MGERFGRISWLSAGWTRAAATCLVAVGLVAGPQAAQAGAPDAAIVVDAKSGKTLYASNADARRHPASLTKMMTLYLLFEAIEAGKTKLSSRITFSAHASAQAPSKLGLKPGQTISVRDAILALVTKSANDVAVAVAEHIAGTENAFAGRMTAKARQIGMSKTTFRNASGLPDSAQITTARDMATLGQALQDHYPAYYAYFSTRSFAWKGQRIGNHNRLLGRVAGVDGIKTGYTRASGFNLVTSVKRSGRQIVATVLGGDTGKQRDKRMASLIEDYLPKASTGKRIAAAIPGAARGIAAGAVATVAPAALPVPRPRPAGDAAESTSVASLIGANSIFALDAVDQGDSSADDEVGVADAPEPVITGWKIQLGATPTQNSAEELLDRAAAKGAKILGGASPYTEPVTRGNSTLYRARFAGFTDKAKARAACTYLSKHDFACLAISD